MTEGGPPRVTRRTALKWGVVAAASPVLGRVRLDRGRAREANDMELNMLADQALEQGLEIPHELIQIKDPGL